MRAFLLWLVPAVVVALAVARVSVWVQPHFSPLVLFPLLVGAALGVLICGLLQLARVNDSRLAMFGTLLVVVLAAAAEHVFFYLDRHSEQLRKASDSGIPEEVVARATFAEYMRAEAKLDDMKVLLWIGNAAAMVVAAAGVVIWYVKFRHVDESAAADSHSRLRHGESSIGEPRPRDADADEANLS
jgi:cytochrome c-type biogenesis protein CcmH/NrfF